MKDGKTYQNYLRDLIFLIKERKAQLQKEEDKDEFSQGLESGYSHVIDMIENQTIGSHIDLEDIGFNDFEKSLTKNSTD